MAKPPKTTKITISGTSAADVIDGRLYGLAQQEQGFLINGNAGNDDLRGGVGLDILNGGDGDDLLRADSTDLLGVSAGAVVYDGGRGSDTLDLSGISVEDGKGLWIRYDGERGWTDFIRTNVLKDDDSVNGSGEPGTVWTYDVSYEGNFRNIENFKTGSGDDLIYILTGGGNNSISSGAGADWVEAGNGNDIVDGGEGKDILSGGWGNDILFGGSGNDAFLIRGRVVGEYTFDIIKDFETKSSEEDVSFDQIWLNDIYSLTWDPSSPNVLKGLIKEGDTIWGEITFEGLTYADANQVPVYHLSQDPFLM